MVYILKFCTLKLRNKNLSILLLNTKWLWKFKFLQKIYSVLYTNSYFMHSLLHVCNISFAQNICLLKANNWHLIVSLDFLPIPVCLHSCSMLSFVGHIYSCPICDASSNIPTVILRQKISLPGSSDTAKWIFFLFFQFC